MDTKINYTFVGLFVFTLGLCMISFLLWMSKYGLEEQKLDHYTIEISESVAGLNIESPVKFHGVEVGNVQAINIDKKNSEIIQVSINVKPNTPIKEDSFAVITPQGITGLSYIELKGGSKESARLKVGSSISSGQSLFDKLEYSASNVSESIIQTLYRIDQLLSEKNLINAEKTLTNLALLSENSNQLLEQQVTQLLSKQNLANLQTTLANTAVLSQSLNQESHQFVLSANKTFADYSRLSDKLYQLTSVVNQRFEQGEFDIRQMTEHHLENLNGLLLELKMLSTQTNDVLLQLKNSPSDLFFKQESIKFGPGEN